MFADHCTHKTDNTGHCLDPTCKNYAFYRGEEQRLAAVALSQQKLDDLDDADLEKSFFDK